MDAASVGRELLAFVRRRYEVRSERERERLREAISRVESLLAEITYGYDEASSSRREWCRRELQVIYDHVSELVPVPIGKTYDQPADMLVNMIACGRMYYWLRTFDGEKTLDGLTEAELRAELKREDVTRSTAAAVQSVLKRVLDGTPVSPYHLESARDECANGIIEGRYALLKALGE